jgi:hypothetical protein
MEKIVRYGRIGNVVVMNFPDENGAKHFITQIETQNILRKMGMDKLPVQSFANTLKPRQVV